jgi:cyanate lyase
LQRRRGAGLGELQLAHGLSKYFTTAPAYTQRALHSAEAREVGVAKPLE